ncbi:MAG: prephenate dehydrogenase [Lachnospiraceae bacterium]|nr:prephenate dehydrogenase [Lachnospiraceae bacterium]
MLKWDHKDNILIVGLGLIGGSYARALKKQGYTVNAIDKDPDAIAYALEERIIDRGKTDASLIQDADRIILALYPSLVTDWIRMHRGDFKSGSLLTDVTGIKSAIVYEIQKILPEDAEFIAAHPMAGREVYGVRNSSEKIFTGANYIVVPTEKNTPDAVAWCRELGQILGFSTISVLSPEEHDKMIAYVSQLTHCIAVALMTCEDNEHLKDYTGDSFRDLTRIANINADMWTELFFMNREALLEYMDGFIDEMKTLRDMIDRQDQAGLKAKMQLSSQRRGQFDRKP